MTTSFSAPLGIKPTIKLILQYFRSDQKWFAITSLVVILATNFLLVAGAVRFNSWNGNFYDALQNKSFQGMCNMLPEFSVIFLWIISSAVVSKYLSALFAFRWRKWMTVYYLERWFSNKTYYRMMIPQYPVTDNSTIDNPDQRLSEDLRALPTLSLSLLVTTFSEILSLCSFLVLLWNFSGILSFMVFGQKWELHGYLVWIAAIYALVGSIIISYVGRKLPWLDFWREKCEANFRFPLMRIRERREEIAMTHGEWFEKNFLSMRFQDIINNFYQIIQCQFNINISISIYNNLHLLIPAFAAAPRYFTGAITFGVIMQTIGAFRYVMDAFSILVSNFVEIANWKAVIRRITEFDAIMESLAKQPFSAIEPSLNAIIIEDCVVQNPEEGSILGPISFTIQAGERVLLKGRSGLGKTSLLRVLAGLWPHYTAHRLALPQGSVYFIPQRPYMPLVTLRECLCYPSITPPVDDATLCELLRSLELPRLTHQLDTIQDWSNILSIGEQQRISVIRALLAKPAFLIADEPTASLNTDMEKIVFELFAKHLPNVTLLTVGHNETLHAYHERIIDLGSLVKNP